MIDADDIERLLDQIDEMPACNCGSGHPPGPLHENKPWWRCPWWNDAPAKGSKAAKELEIQKARKKK